MVLNLLYTYHFSIVINVDHNYQACYWHNAHCPCIWNASEEWTACSRSVWILSIICSYTLEEWHSPNCNTTRQVGSAKYEIEKESKTMMAFKTAGTKQHFQVTMILPRSYVLLLISTKNLSKSFHSAFATVTWIIQIWFIIRNKVCKWCCKDIYMFTLH